MTTVTPKHTIAERLSPRHIKELRASGLNDKTIRASGCYTIRNSNLLRKRLRNGSTELRAPALVIPYSKLDGSRNGFLRVKLDRPRVIDGDPHKYEQPKSSTSRLYFPPNCLDTIRDESEPLLITEGEKKSLALAQHGYATIGLGGVDAWHAEDFDGIPLDGRTVYIVFDADPKSKTQRHVQKAAARLANVLQARGAKVLVVKLPLGDDDQKQGVDDYLLTHKPAEFRKLLAGAMVPDKMDAKRIDPADAARSYLKTMHTDGVCRQRYWRGEWWQWWQGAYRSREQSEIRADLIRHLDTGYRQLGTATINGVLDHAKSQAILPRATEPGEWLGQPIENWQPDEILASRNSLIHLPSLATNGDAVRPATPRLFTTAALDFDFQPTAPPPETWLKFLSELWPDDPQSRKTLREWFGYCLTPDTRQQKILMLVGPKRAGKGTVAKVLQHVVGPANVVGPTLASLSQNFGLSQLVGKSLAIISDARLSGRTDSAVVLERLLSVSGEDTLTIDRKYAEAWTGKLGTRLMLLTNELPRLSDASGALASRFIVLQLKTSFYGREDHRLFDKLQPELPGILLWAIGGWQRLRKRGRFIQPDSGRKLVVELEDLASPVTMFVREKCRIGAEYSVPVNRLYRAWCAWCSNKGNKFTGTQQTFGRDLRAALSSIDTRQRRDGKKVIRFYTGIGLVTQ